MITSFKPISLLGFKKAKYYLIVMIIYVIFLGLMTGIVTISQKLRELSRDADIVARYGGEEFILLLPRTSLQDARVLAQRICDEIRMIRVAISDDNSIKTTVSIGVSELSKKDENIDQLISRADIKLYEAKENGRNGVCI